MFEDLGGEEADPRLRQLLAAERTAATAYLACLDALTALWDSTPAADRTGRRPHVLAEAGVALGLHPISVEARLAVAFTLQTHPQLRTLLATGRLGVAHVLAAAQETGALGDDDLAARVLAHVLDSGGPDSTPGWDDTPARLRRALARAAVRLDPAGAARRRAEQLTDRTGVRLRPQSDGLAAWVATGPAPQLLAADRLLRAAASPDGPHDPRSTGQRQLDTLLGALTARAGGADGVRGVELELQIEIPVAVTATRPVRGCTPEPAAIRADLTHDLLDLLTTTSHATSRATSHAPSGTPACPTAGQPDPDQPAVDHPGTPTDHHPAPDPDLDTDPVEPPPDPDDLPPDLQHDDPPDDPHGDPHDDPHDDPHGDPHGDPHDGADRAERREQRREAPRTPADTQQDQHALGRRTAPPVPRLGVPELLGTGPLDPAALAELLTDPAGLPVGLSTLTIRRICLDPHGQAVAVDPRAIPLAQLLAPPRTPQRHRTRRTDTDAPAGAPPGAPPGAQLLSRLLQHLPTPPPAIPGYRPTADQTRVVRARDHTCTFPGCSRTSRHTDLDHRRPHPQGATSTSNLHPLCRHHHRLKHTGWTCTRHPDGTTTWTSPRGRPHRSTPG